MSERLSIPDPVVPAKDEPLIFAPGSRFGRYDIIGPLGSGGMGQVYRARDLRLGRDLAIKVLSSRLSSDPQDLERFEREARAASALNHPNIITIFELGQVNHTYYIAMELVEGTLLRDMLLAGPIPLQNAIPIAAQAADGLAKAHEAGVVHRDLKPENIMVTRDGFVKILDFGIAKLVEPDLQKLREAETVGPTRTLPGMVMGTLEYMSPEQANGLPVDFQSDQFSFGSVMYEMVTGKRSFPGSSKAETLAAILRDQPEPVVSLNPQVPAPLAWAIDRCLNKSPRDRYASTRDLARDLATIRDRLSEAPSLHSPPRLSNLPTQRTALIGREQEVEQVKELLLRDSVHLVTLTGPGGIGKSRLGLQVAAAIAGNFPGGVFFIPLAGAHDPAMIPSLIAQALGMRQTGRQVTIESLKEYFRDLRTDLLLCFDNFEHLLAAAPAVAQLLSIAPRLKLLVTSRAPLHVYGEQEFPVPSLELPDFQSISSLQEFSRNPAVALFLERAAAVKPNFELTDENVLAVATICTRLDGLPLAIELAAARIKLLSPSEMQARLESCLQLLTGGAKDLPLRQQTLRGTIDWSYDLLSPAEQMLFRRVSVFAGGCTLEEVEAVCNTKQDLDLDVLDGMASLVDKSLVGQIETTYGESRFVLLDTILEYGLEHLSASGEESATRRAHAAYCLVLAEDFSSQVAGARSDWALVFDAEHDNFRAAMEWMTETGNAEWGLRLGAALFPFWEMREHLTEARDRLRQLLKLEAATSRSSLRVRALFAAGVLAGEQGDYTEARGLLEESRDIARELDDVRGVGIALNALAAIARNRGDLEASRSLFEENLAVWRMLDDRAMVARSLSNLASVVKLQGDYSLARLLFEECLTMFTELGDRNGMAWSLNYEGDVAQEQGDKEFARGLYGHSLAIFRDIGDQWGVAGCLVDLGNLARDQRDYETSRSHYFESMKLFQELGQKRGMARLLDCLACSAATQGKPESALRFAGAAAAMRHVLSAPLSFAEQAQLDKALELARQSISPTIAAAAWMDGWTMPPEKAIRTACEP